MAQEKGFSIDEKGFNKLMDEQRQRGRKATRNKLASKVNTVSNFKVEITSPANNLTVTDVDQKKFPWNYQQFLQAMMN